MWVQKQYNKLVTEFLWKGKPPKVKYNALINSISNGGLKLQDLVTKIRAVKLKWIKMLSNPNYTAVWKSYIISLFPKGCLDIPKYNIDHKDFPEIGKFHYEIFGMWAHIHYNTIDETNDVASQIIWLNSNIKIDNKIVIYKRWVDKGINTIHDNGEIASKNFLQDKYSIEIRHMEYNSIIHAIPKAWKNALGGHSYNTDFIPRLTTMVKVGKDMRPLDEVCTKDIYCTLLENIRERPTSEGKWSQTTELDLTEEEWDEIYTKAYLVTRDTKLISFNFKITHRILACGHNLYNWKINKDDICKICNKEPDTIEHHLVKCPDTLAFWDILMRWWYILTRVYFPVYTYEFIFWYTK
jgi:hypothetical protein